MTQHRPTAPDWPALMTETLAAVYVCRSVASVRKLREAGEFPQRARVGGSLLYRRADLDRWIATLPTEGEQEEIDAACYADEVFNCAG